MDETLSNVGVLVSIIVLPRKALAGKQGNID
jgi:hypothetical protein